MLRLRNNRQNYYLVFYYWHYFRNCSWRMWFICYLDSVCTSNFLSHYLDYVNGSLATLNLLDTYEQYKKLLDSPLRYFAVAGIQQIATSVIFIIVILAKINKNMQIWSRVLTILLVLNLAFNFVIAVLSSMSLIYFNELFKN